MSKSRLMSTIQVFTQYTTLSCRGYLLGEGGGITYWCDAKAQNQAIALKGDRQFWDNRHADEQTKVCWRFQLPKYFGELMVIYVADFNCSSSTALVFNFVIHLFQL